MIRASVRFDTRGRAALEREFSRRLEKSALQMTDRAAAKAKDRIRADMAAAGLGRLGFALGSGSDLKKSGQVHRKGNGWSASGWVAVRSRSQRTQGAIESYTEGSTILPRRGRYLWFATDDIKRLARVPLPNSGGNSYGNVRLEPRLWDRTYGRTLGPLFPMKAADGTPLLAIRNATLSLSAGSAFPPGGNCSGPVRTMLDVVEPMPTNASSATRYCVAFAVPSCRFPGSRAFELITMRWPGSGAVVSPVAESDVLPP